MKGERIKSVPDVHLEMCASLKKKIDYSKSAVVRLFRGLKKCISKLLLILVEFLGVVFGHVEQHLAGGEL